jgi:hypothetical protein
VEKTATTADMDASQNYWGTTNTTIIDSMIYDKNDDDSCSSFINYLPLLDIPDPQTPIAPTPTPSPTPTSSPDPSTSPSATPTPTTTTSPFSTPDSTSDPANTISNPTANPGETLNNGNPNPNPSTHQAIPEFSLWGVILVLFAAGSMFILMLKRKNLKPIKA